MNVRLIQVDGKLPNLALMKLSYWHKLQGDTVNFSRSVERDLLQQNPDRVYASCIFTYSAPRLERLRREWPEAIIGGTGTTSKITVEEATNSGGFERYDYSIYPDYEHSIGFTQRGCRLKCGFCVVPAKEGKVRVVNRIENIWRGPGHPKNIILLDNDFFGQPASVWKEHLTEVIEGGFKVSFNQGINLRLVDDEAAAWLAKVPYYDDQFKVRRLYTAWDNIGDEDIFMRGVDRLEKAGVSPKHLMVYMLIGYDPTETWERIFYRFRAMTERGISVYPMPYDRKNLDHTRFQRWVIWRYWQFIPWEKFTNERSTYPKPQDEATVKMFQ